MRTKVAINGFGRIGRSFLRLIYSNLDYEVVAINDLANAEILAHLFKYDSIHGVFDQEIRSENNNLIVNGYKIPVFQIKDDERFPWDDLEIDVVIEATGKRLTYDLSSIHLDSGAKKVIITAPPKSDSIKLIVMGVNEASWLGNALGCSRNRFGENN